MNQERIVFAHMLRGIAAISVLLGHYLGTFFAMQPSIGGLLGVPPINDLPQLIWPLSFFKDHAIIAGQFGVGVFFIISGFVIPFSIEDNDRSQFVIRRMFRIYPVYIVGFLIVVSSIWVLDRSFGTSFPYPLAQVSAHLGVLTRGLFGYYRIDGISWTLEIEIAFYLVVACLGGRSTFLSVIEYLVIATLLTVISAFCMLGLFGIGLQFVGIQLGVSLLLVLGLVYHSLIKNRIDILGFAVVQSYIGILIVGLFYWMRPIIINGEWMLGYLLAMLVFGLSYRFRSNFPGGRILSHLSDISYPLYVVHALFGYAIIYTGVRAGASVYVALACGILCSYLVAVFLHRHVEKQAISISKRLTGTPFRGLQQPR
jgi:peptidoglycan/LPS O-acetylase OafA/YrhL